jgi:hypothetical protein
MEESMMVGPYSFEWFGMWQNFTHDRFRANYSFVKAGLLPETDSAAIRIIFKGIYKDNE